MFKKNKQLGFSLPELMIVVLLIAILATLAYPSYQHFIRKTRLANVRSELLHNAKNLERYYTQRSTFTHYDPTALVQNEFFDISFTPAAPNSPPNPSASGYTLQAAPNAERNSQEPCTVFLNDNGVFWAQSKDSAYCPGYEQP